MPNIRPIPSLDGQYGADRQGNIYRLTGWHGRGKLARPRRIVPIANQRKRYQQFNVYLGGKHRLIYVHHVVAEAWLGPRPPGHQVHHRDENRQNNRVGNLRYKLRIKHFLIHSRNGSSGCCRRQLSDRAIERILKMEGKKTAKVVAQKFGMTDTYIRTLWSGKARRVRSPRWLGLVRKSK